MTFKMSKTAHWGLAAALTTGVSIGAAHAAEPSGPALITANCGTCHVADAKGKFPRISEIRKTPEGWDMTMSRMERWHGVHVDAADRAAIVKYLSDVQGLAPAEAEPFRYALEQRPGTVEQHADEEVGQFCARCHSMARPGLQRRDAAEWKRLVHTHVGQWPSLEFQAMGRDRDWWTTANTTIKDKLAKTWGFTTTAWSKWKGHSASVAGTWAVSGHQPGKGDYAGTMTVSGGDGDKYDVSYALTYANGETVATSGKSIIYTGYEWRGSLELGGNAVREVYQLSADGSRMSGRWFDAVHDELGGDVVSVKLGGKKPALAAVQPQALKAGATTTVTLVGAGLSGQPDFGPGISVVKSEAKPWGLEVAVEVKAGTKSGSHDVSVGGAKLAGAVAVYDKIDRVQVEPPYTIARIGDAGGPIPRHFAQFEAVGYLNGKDGKPGTKDDVRLGVFPAQWSTDNFDEVAKSLDDAKFAGHIDQKGLFTPGEAGRNPERAYQTNNVGNLKVAAAVDDGKGGTIGSEGQLIVTVQRWVDAWIR